MTDEYDRTFTVYGTGAVWHGSIGCLARRVVSHLICDACWCELFDRMGRYREKITELEVTIELLEATDEKRKAAESRRSVLERNP